MRIGIDLGGTKIEGIVIDEAGAERARKRIPTPRGDYRGTIGAIAGLVSEFEAQLKLSNTPVGIGTPGAISLQTGLIKNSNSTWLIGQPLDRDLQAELKRPVKLANDANCFALSEATDGAAAGAGVVFGVILGTGVGGGIVVHGQALNGVNGIAGEWGHNPLPWLLASELPGPACYCGKQGCNEMFLSGPGLARDFNQATGQNLKGEEIIMLAEQSDPQALRAVERYENRLARGLAAVINVVDPEVIVLGGGLSNVARLYESVPRLWREYVFSDTVQTKLVRAKFGDSSGVRGAAWLNQI